MSSLAKWFVFGGLEIEENCAWCLAILVIFMGLGAADSWGKGVLKLSYGRSRNKEGDLFMGC